MARCASALAQLERACTCIIIRLRIYIRELAHARPPMSSISVVKSTNLGQLCSGNFCLLHTIIERAGASPPSLTAWARYLYIWYDRPGTPKCFYALLFHRHLSTFHGTQYGPNGTREAGLLQRREAPLSLTGQGKPGFAERWRERRASETAEGD